MSHLKEHVVKRTLSKVAAVLAFIIGAMTIRMVVWLLILVLMFVQARQNRPTAA